MANYTELWTELGVDLDRHDQLCLALPGLFEDVYLEQENRPDGMSYWNMLIGEIHGLRIQELAEHRARGGKVVGTFCLYVPDEILLAAGAVSVGLCGGSQFWVPDGEKVLPRNLCPLIKALVGAKISRTCPYFQSCDLLVGETTCDGKKKTWEILGTFAPIYVMELPQKKEGSAQARWTGEISALAGQIGELTGNQITVPKLREAIEKVNRRRKALARLAAVRKNDPVPISGRDALLVTQTAFYDDPDRFTEQVNKLCAELEERVARGEGVIASGTPRILVTGTPMAIPNWKLHHIIETSGGVVVGEENCTGSRYYTHLVDNRGDTLPELYGCLAERYLKLNCACFTPNEARIEDIIGLVRDYRVDGVIYYNLQFCQTYAVEFYQVERELKKAGVPVLFIETDYSEQDIEVLRTRVQAFLEMIRK
ncbi:MAG: double-cubane-cluster-containing anaerobic reductase [Bacillota bacterium]|nr:double-cubane-cluster-containing anaerobic reductase [Bacillota bacterium]